MNSLLQNSRQILSTMRPERRVRAQQMMKLHQKGKGECILYDRTAILHWPATNGKGEGDGEWTAVITPGLHTCACPSFQYGKPLTPCKHLILLARLAIYHSDEAQRRTELAEMQVCSG